MPSGVRVAVRFKLEAWFPVVLVTDLKNVVERRVITCVQKTY